MRVRCANCAMIYDRTKMVTECPRCDSNAADPLPRNESAGKPEGTGPRELHDAMQNARDLLLG